MVLNLTEEQRELWETKGKDLINRLGNNTCNICGNKNGIFLIRRLPYFDWAKDFPGDLDLRESLVCDYCGSSSRDRMFVWALAKCLGETKSLQLWNNNKTIKMLESAGRRNHPKYLSEKFEYYNTEYVPEKISLDPSKFADFQDLHFCDNNFDYVLSSDVFEHIRMYQNALKEVYRVLKSGGKFVLQVPYCNIYEKNKVKVKPDGDKDVLITEPEYHAGDSLVYRIYGKELKNDLRNVGFKVEYVCKSIPEFMISFQPIFICTK